MLANATCFLRLSEDTGSGIFGPMARRISTFSLMCSLLALMGAEASAAAGDCPNEATSAKEAARAYKLRRSEFLPEAAKAFEAAYRCMPVDSRHEERWEHLASYLETLQKMPSDTPPAARTQLCRARELIDGYQQSLRSVSPLPDAARYAAAERLRVEEDLARLAPGSDLCEVSNSKPLDSKSAAAPIQKTSGPPSTVQVPPPKLHSPQTTASPARLHTRLLAQRPMVIAGAVTGSTGVVSLVVMGVGLGIGNRAESEAAAAMAAGQLQKIRNSIHSDGVVGNRMAYSGAIIGGALIVTGAALLVVAVRRARGSQPRVSGAATGLLVRF